MWTTAERYCRILTATLRPSTVENYRTAFRGFLRFLAARHPEVTSFSELRRVPHLENWLIFLAAKRPPYKPGTRELTIRKMRRFFADIGDDGWRWQEAPPPQLLTRRDFPPRQEYLPRPLASDLDVALQRGLAENGRLCARALLLARYTGVRSGELLRLRRDCLVDLSEECSAIRVPLGKLRSERVIPIDSRTVELIKRLRSECGDAPTWIDPDTGKPVRLLICREDGRPIGKTSLGYTLQLVVKSLGIQERVWVHRLRHTYATDLLRHGVGIVAVMRMLGHRRIHMTMHYIEVTQVDLAREFQRAFAKVKDQYTSIRRPTNLVDPRGSATSAFDDLLALLQALRLDHSSPQQRIKLRRLVERLRRAQSDFERILSR